MGRVVRRGNRSQAAEDRRGAAAVELAVVLPFFMLLLVGFMQFAWMFLVRHSMLHAAREGARVYAVQGGTAAQAESRSRQVLTDLYGSSNAGNFTVTSSASGRDRIITIRVPYNAQIVNLAGMVNILNNLSALIPGSSGPAIGNGQMTARVVMRDEGS